LIARPCRQLLAHLRKLRKTKGQEIVGPMSISCQG
jgi:hypothetical protein